jgi:hypothetical protein
MDQAKLRLSAKEAELVANADWILTKNQILQKVNQKLARLQTMQDNYLQQNPLKLEDEVRSVPPKISRGENYKGLPWMMLDYPRYFVKQDHFAVRCMFWWGNFFSITLQLSGACKIKYQPAIEAGYEKLKNDGFVIGVSDDLWEHDFGPVNYAALETIKETGFMSCVREKESIKLAKKIPLQQWNEAEDILLNAFSTLIGILLR